MNKALIVTDKQKLLIRDEHPTRITTVIPTSKIVNYRGVDLVVMPHDLDEVRVLNNMGYNIDSPVSHYYKYSGRYTPFVAQAVTTDKMTLNTRMFVLNQIGTGKTLATAWAYDYLRSRGKVKKMLIVTPLSTMERVWADEFFHHFPHLTCQVLYGTAKRRVSQLEFPADVYIINHDGLKVPEIRDALLKRDDIDVVTIDELAAFRNSSTDRWKALSKIIAGKQYVWGLTGTPIPNRPTDAWAQCRLLAPSRVPPYFGRFREMVERKVSQFKWVPRDNALDTVREAMQPAVLFRRDECIDLPPTMYEYRYVEMSAEQKKAYKQMINSLVAEAAAGQIVAVNEAVKAAKLAQIACISKDTQVLSARGWVPIQDVTDADLVWDGEEWVGQGGAVIKGTSRVVDCGGVHMTADHLVLSTEGWVTAEDMSDGWKKGREFDWAEVREPDGYRPGGHWGTQGGSMAVPVCMRWRDSGTCAGSAGQNHMALRLPASVARNDREPPAQTVDSHARQWASGVRGMVYVPDVLGRHEGRLPAYAQRSADRRVSAVQQVKLQMGEQPCEGSDRQRVRVLDRAEPRRVYHLGENELCDVAVPVPVRKRGSEDEPVSALETQNASSELWLSSRKRCAQKDTHPTFQCMDKNEVEVRKPCRQRLGQLWKAWHNCVCGVGGVVSGFLGRHALWLSTRVDFRPTRQQHGVLSEELPLGDREAAGKQQAVERLVANPGRPDESVPGGGVLRASPSYARCEAESVWMDSGTRTTHTDEEIEVYDLINCGPRNRFVVRGSGGELRIVHNCGVAYDQEGKCVQFDCPDRIAELKEIIRESGSKVIVFVPLTGGLNMVATELAKEWQTAVVHGGVGKAERDAIFGDFQTPGGLHVLVAHPRCMSHGLTLTEASTIVWFIPTNSHDEYEQANGRITRPGQKLNTLIMHIEGSDIERRMYKRLETKSSMQNLLLDMIKEQLDEQQKQK